MSDQKDSRQKLKQTLQSLDVGEPEPPLKDAFASLAISETSDRDVEPEAAEPEVGKSNRKQERGTPKARQGKQAT